MRITPRNVFSEQKPTQDSPERSFLSGVTNQLNNDSIILSRPKGSLREIPSGCFPMNKAQMVGTPPPSLVGRQLTLDSSHSRDILTQDGENKLPDSPLGNSLLTDIDQSRSSSTANSRSRSASMSSTTSSKQQRLLHVLQQREASGRTTPIDGAIKEEGKIKARRASYVAALSQSTEKPKATENEASRLRINSYASALKNPIEIADFPDTFAATSLSNSSVNIIPAPAINIALAKKPSLWQKFLSLFSKKAKTPEQQVTAMQVKKVSNFIHRVKMVDSILNTRKSAEDTNQFSGKLNRSREALYSVDQLSIEFDSKSYSLANFVGTALQLLKKQPAELARAIEDFEQKRQAVIASGDNPYTLLDQLLGINPDLNSFD